jgi:phosphoglycolate phosphatase
LASIVFDLDGTLVDSAKLLSDVGNAVLDELHLPLMDADEARSYIGNGPQVFLEKTLQARKADLGDGFVDALGRFLKF